MTLDEFKTWLNKLIADKKGALPDLNDWKQIKDNLDKVKAESFQYDLDLSGYNIPVHDMGEEEYNTNHLGYNMSALEALLNSTEGTFSNCYAHKDMPALTITYNGQPATLDNNYGKTIEEYLNNTCRGR